MRKKGNKRREKQKEKEERKGERERERERGVRKWEAKYVYKKEKQNLIDFNGISTYRELFYAQRLGNLVHCAFIYIYSYFY